VTPPGFFFSSLLVLINLLVLISLLVLSSRAGEPAWRSPSKSARYALQRYRIFGRKTGLHFS
jgi:hypothetical protein